MQYAALAGVLMALTAVGVRTLMALGLPSWLAKIATDLGGSFLSFIVQHRVIFVQRAKESISLSEEARRLSV